MRISSSVGPEGPLAEADFREAAGFTEEGDFFFGAGFFLAAGEAAAFPFGFPSTIPSVARAVGSRPAGSVCFPDSILVFLATFCYLRLSAKPKTARTVVASGFCKAVARRANFDTVQPCDILFSAGLPPRLP